MGTRKEHFTVRLTPDTLDQLTRQSQRTGLAKSALAEQYLREGLRMAKHPGIVFRDGPVGRRPGFSGRRLDVWDVVETVQHNHGDADAAVEYLNVPPSLVRTALGYYAEYQEEIDDWIGQNCLMAEEEEAACRKAQAVVARLEARSG